MMVGYVNHHEGDMYRMLNLETVWITEAWEIIWLFRMYYKYENSEVTKKVPVVSLQVPQTVGSDDKDDEVVNTNVAPAPAPVIDIDLLGWAVIRRDIFSLEKNKSAMMASRMEFLEKGVIKQDAMW